MGDRHCTTSPLGGSSATQPAREGRRKSQGTKRRAPSSSGLSTNQSGAKSRHRRFRPNRASASRSPSQSPAARGASTPGAGLSKLRLGARSVDQKLPIIAGSKVTIWTCPAGHIVESTPMPVPDDKQPGNSRFQAGDARLLSLPPRSPDEPPPAQRGNVCRACLKNLETVEACLNSQKGSLVSVRCPIRGGFDFTVRCQRGHQWNIPSGWVIRKAIFFKDWCSQCALIEQSEGALKQKRLLDEAKRKFEIQTMLTEFASKKAPPQALPHFPEFLSLERNLSAAERAEAVRWVLRYYKVPRQCLGVPDAKQTDRNFISTQYRKLALAVHPDKSSDERAGDAFVFLQQAYRSLTTSSGTSGGKSTV